MNAIKRKKIAATQLIRHTIQFVAFILFPGLFIFTFAAIRDVYTALIKGSFSFSAQAGSLLVLLAVFPITILWGRFFCGFLCSFGAMGDFLWAVSRKIFKKPLRVSPKVDGKLKLLKYLMLGLIVVFVWTLAVPVGSTMNPWTIFGMYASLSGWSSTNYLFTFGALLLFLIMIGFVLIERFFCRYLCPLGAIFALTSNFRLFRIKKPREKCGNCRLCTWKCSMGINLDQQDVIASGECIDCFACTDICPRKNAKAVPAPAVAGTMAAFSMTGLYYAGNLLSRNLSANTDTPTVIIDSSTVGNYQDGVYTGTGTGFKGSTTVQVTVENGNISDITVLSTGDDEEFFNRAKSTVIGAILSQQSTQVDTVTGATFSSSGIIEAVADALGVSDENSDSSQQNVSQGSDETQDENASSSGSGSEEISSLKDGVYSGTGTGFRGDTTVSVTVANGRITDITVDSYADDEQFFNRAENNVIASIINQQSVRVDTVTGATYSSNGIIEAVANALGLSFENTNSTISDQARGGFHGGAPSRG